MRRLLAVALLCAAPAFADTAQAPDDLSLSARTLGVVINDADPLSMAIGDYYRVRRKIPEENVVHVSFDARRSTIGAAEFTTLAEEVAAKLPPRVQALALTWMRPYRVECMSITTAFAAGFDRAFCSTRCSTTRWSPYFNANTHRPYDELRWRPTMMIAAADIEHARDLIDRGVASDGTQPQGTAYLVSTSDLFRNVRARGYADASMMVGKRRPVEIIQADKIEEKSDVLFYFTGLAKVDAIDTNHFLPGAVADHLTSLGGDLDGKLQMSSRRWLEAGATGSYGTVNEPCNLPGKFPNPGMMMKRYLDGETLIEAYWKSVAMPGQGLFIGEPLARPYGVGRQ